MPLTDAEKRKAEASALAITVLFAVIARVGAVYTKYMKVMPQAMLDDLTPALEASAAVLKLMTNALNEDKLEQLRKIHASIHGERRQ